MKQVTINLYSFDELSEEAKQKAIEKNYDINVDHEWWNFDGLLDLSSEQLKAIKIKRSPVKHCLRPDEKGNYFDERKPDLPKDSNGNTIGYYPDYTSFIKYKIESFDIDRNSFVQFTDIEVIDDEIFRKFLHIPSNLWGSISYYFDNRSRNYNTEIHFDSEECEDFTDKEQEILDNATEIWNDHVENALHDLRKSYEYLMSEEAIIETLKANEYTFEADGTINNG